MDFSKLPAILTPDLGLLFWMLLAFAVVFFVLAKYGFPAIVGMVEERNRYIEDSLKKAHEAQERLANIEKVNALKMALACADAFFVYLFQHVVFLTITIKRAHKQLKALKAEE